MVVVISWLEVYKEKSRTKQKDGRSQSVVRGGPRETYKVNQIKVDTTGPDTLFSLKAIYQDFSTDIPHDAAMAVGANGNRHCRGNKHVAALKAPA